MGREGDDNKNAKYLGMIKRVGSISGKIETI